MRVCIPTDSPGGPASPVADSFQESDLFDFYELGDDGRFDLYVQIRNCAGTCKDDVETVARRGAQVVIVNEISANYLHRLAKSGISVYRALGGPSEDSIAALHDKRLSVLSKIKS